MRVLIGCEFSGIVREAFRRRGHDAWSCDLLPTEIPGQHHQRPVEEVLGEHWDLGIFHPPCTTLTNAGVRWLYNKDGSRHEKRWKLMQDACDFFNLFLTKVEHIARVAIENPIMHKHARALIVKPYTQIIQPWQFGHGETKATCLWLKNLPELVPTQIVDGRHGRVHRETPGPDRWKNRSRTLSGVADGMAAQWGSLAQCTPVSNERTT